MEKIPTLYVRDYTRTPHLVTPEVTPGCEWVIAGEGAATRKWDGICVMRDQAGEWWARRVTKEGKTRPAGFVAVEHDAATGKTVGWEPIDRSGFAKFHAEALGTEAWAAGTYELVGPKINKNPDGFPGHALVPHGWQSRKDKVEADSAPRDFEGLRDWLAAHEGWEGIVWHHPDGRRAKLKRRDFGAR